jgi:transcriptional regulator with GAF, ATPase, and Fis domain
MADAPTMTYDERNRALYVRRFSVTVVEGPDRGASIVSDDDEITVGTASGTSLRLTDSAVSRHHCALRATSRGLELRDLSSTNGTYLGDADVVLVFIRSGSRVRLGATVLVVEVLDDRIAHPLAVEHRWGDIIGASPAMRRLYATIQKVAPSEASVLIQGESGTGKELVAEAIHLGSTRANGPFVVVDCGALPRQLAESELFGHVRGSFTGADTDREGAFETAHGGTLFLDEIGELPLDLQPLLLRALEQRTVRRIGASQYREVDVRIVAASKRDLRVEVNAKRFRSDLFYRLNVVRLVVPPLRERAGDVALLAQHFWESIQPGTEISRDLVTELATHDWPGNVRELKNAVERSAVIGWNATARAEQTYSQAKEVAIQQWERTWLAWLLDTNDHNLSKAARSAGMGRSHLRRLCQRHGLRTKPYSGNVE